MRKGTSYEHERWTEASNPLFVELVESVRKRSDGARGAEERKRNKRAERQMDRNMIYPDLGSSLRTMKGGTRERWQ